MKMTELGGLRTVWNNNNYSLSINTSIQAYFPREIQLEELLQFHHCVPEKCKIGT